MVTFYEGYYLCIAPSISRDDPDVFVLIKRHIHSSMYLMT